MATFFGEVREIPSRAVWWSDTEDDPEEEEKESQIVRPKSSVFTVHGNSAELKSCSKLFVSLARKLSSNNGSLMAIRNDNFKGDICALHKRENGEFLLTLSNAFIDKNRPVSLAKFVYETILSQIDWTKATMILVSKDFSNVLGMQYFYHQPDFNAPILGEISQALSKDQMPLLPCLPPQTLTNYMELALVELAIHRKLPFLVLILPSENPETGSGWIPQEILNNVNSFHDLSFSNLIT